MTLYHKIEHKIEFVVGSLWNKEYNTWCSGIYKKPLGYNRLYKYHGLSNVNWYREMKKINLYHNIYNWYYITSHPDFTWDVFAGQSKGWLGMSINKNITWDHIQKHINNPWDWIMVVRNPNITWDHIKQINIYDSFIISQNPNITLDIVINNKTYLWSNWLISMHPNVTWDIIQTNPGYKWDWDGISENPNVSWDIIKGNLTKPWNWSAVSRNKNITMDIIIENPKMPWDWYFVSANVNITWDFVDDNLDKQWNIYTLWTNKFIKQAEISMTKWRKHVNRRTNYLAKYIVGHTMYTTNVVASNPTTTYFRLIIIMLEYY